MTPTQLGIAHGMMLVRETVAHLRGAPLVTPSFWRWPWPSGYPLTTDCDNFTDAVARLGAGPRRKR